MMKKIISLMLIALMILGVFPVMAATGEIIITVHDDACKMSGEMTESTSDLVKGPTGLSSYYGSGTATYSFAGISADKYDLYVYNLPVYSTPDAVEATVVSENGTETVELNYAGGNEGWLPVGTFYFSGKTNESVEFKVMQKSSIGIQRVAAVKLVPNTGKELTLEPPSGEEALENSEPRVIPKDGEFIMGCEDPGFVKNGKWTDSSIPMPSGQMSWYSFAGGSTATYYPNLAKQDGVTVYYLRTAPNGNEDPSLKVEIFAEDETIVKYIDTLNGGDAWVELGTFNFAGDNSEYIKLTKETDSCTRATDLKFSYKSGDTKVTLAQSGNNKPQPKKPPVSKPESFAEPKVVPEGGELIMGCEDPGFIAEGNWIDSSLNMVSGQMCWYSFGKGDTATYYPNLAKHEGITVYYLRAAQSGKEDPKLKVEIFAEGKKTEQYIDTLTGGNGWLELGTFDFAGDNSEYIKLIKENDSCTRATDLKFAYKGEEKVEFLSALKGTENEILERLGMLLGEGEGVTEEYLKKVPTRVQAAVLVLRLRGLEEEAKKYTSDDNFADIAGEEWAENILAYIKAHPELGMVGVGDNKFEPSAFIDAQQYGKILLEALGYKYNVDFTWDETFKKLEEVGIVINKDGEFTINELASATVSALSLKMKDGKLTLLGNVIAEREGIVDEQYLENPQELSAELEAAQTEARHRSRGIIYNNDGNDTYKEYANYPGDFDVSDVTESLTHENFLSKRTTGIENYQVGSVFYCTGVFNSYNHRSSGETSTRKRDWTYMLADTEMDCIETQIDFCQKNDIEFMWSMRMNDCHDSDYEESELDPFKQEHLDWLIGRKADAFLTMKYGAQWWSALDYGEAGVRQKVYNIIKDVVTRYDVDGIQLDFSRYPLYFRQVCQTGNATPENLERMNNLIRSIRTMMDQVSIERNKPLLLALYVPDSIGFCTALGLDINTWLEEDLIDVACVRTTTAYQSWEDSVADYHPHDVMVYGTIDTLGIDYANADLNKEAALMWRAGMDGVQTFNIYNQHDPIFRTLGSPETCGPVDENYKSKFYRNQDIYGRHVENPDQYMRPISY